MHVPYYTNSGVTVIGVRCERNITWQKSLFSSKFNRICDCFSVTVFQTFIPRNEDLVEIALPIGIFLLFECIMLMLKQCIKIKFISNQTISQLKQRADWKSNHWFDIWITFNLVRYIFKLKKTWCCNYSP